MLFRDGSPSSRMVLLKIFDDKGFTFFTNSTSRKGGDLEANPRASMLFYWPMVARQVSALWSIWTESLKTTGNFRFELKGR